MIPARHLAAALLSLTLGCGSSSGTESAPDATSDGTGGEAGGSGSDDTGTVTPDGQAGTDSAAQPDAGGGPDAAGGTDGAAQPDASSDASAPRDSAIFDTGYFDVLAPDGACKCQPYWCGCGTCDPAQIACAVDPPPCTRGCASSCPEIAQVTCSCDQGHCVRAGVDASSIGCLQDPDCPPGDCCAHHSPGSVCVPAPNTCCAGMGVPCP